MYRDTIINTNLNVKIPLFIFSRLVRISFSRAKQYTYIIRINIFNKSDVNIRMMRISYSTPGDAYNRVTVVSPRKCERIFEYIRISFRLSTSFFALQKHERFEFVLKIYHYHRNPDAINFTFFGKEKKSDYLIIISSQLLEGDRKRRR